MLRGSPDLGVNRNCAANTMEGLRDPKTPIKNSKQIKNHRKSGISRIFLIYTQVLLNLYRQPDGVSCTLKAHPDRRFEPSFPSLIGICRSKLRTLHPEGKRTLNNGVYEHLDWESTVWESRVWESRVQESTIWGDQFWIWSPTHWTGSLESGSLQSGSLQSGAMNIGSGH